MKHFKVRCPCCNEEILINIDNSSVKKVITKDEKISEIEISKVLEKHKIELG